MLKQLIRRTILFLMTSVCVVCICSCSFFRAEQLTKLTSEEGELIRKESDEIVRCLTEGDKKGFKDLFSEQIRNDETFSQEVDEAFDFFKCDTYIKSEIVDAAGGGSETDEGDRSEWYVTPEITYIKVLQDADGEEPLERYYGVYYYWQIKDKDEPGNEGLHYMKIALLNTDKYVEIGRDE